MTLNGKKLYLNASEQIRPFELNPMIVYRGLNRGKWWSKWR